MAIFCANQSRMLLCCNFRFKICQDHLVSRLRKSICSQCWLEIKGWKVTWSNQLRVSACEWTFSLSIFANLQKWEKNWWSFFASEMSEKNTYTILLSCNIDCPEKYIWLLGFMKFFYWGLRCWPSFQYISVCIHRIYYPMKWTLKIVLNCRNCNIILCSLSKIQ